LGAGAAAPAVEFSSDSVFDREELYLLSRFRTFVLLAALAALATTFAACGSSSSSDEDPQTVLDSATFEGVTSGDLDLSLAIKAEGDEGGDVNVSLSGPFQGSADKESLPQLGLSAKATGSVNGEDVDFEGGLTLLTDHAFINYEGTEYEVDPTTFGFAKSAFERTTQEQGSENSGDVTACQEAASGLKAGDLVDDLTNEGSADVDGTGTTKISGDLDTGGAIDAIIELTENPACSSQLEAAGPLPIGELEDAKSELTTAVKKAHVDIYVGDDDIIRKVAAEVTIEPKGASNEKVEVDFDLSLSGVNEEQDISAPSDAKPLQGLFLKLGINPIELLEIGSGGGPGIGGLLEGVLDDSSSSGGSSSGGGGQQAYLECISGLGNSATPADLQKCASQAQ
jgi:hypothetical protein